jgi:hypothetical protein
MASNAYNGTRWKQARKAALARDRFCQDCGTNENLHVHHIRPVKTFADPTDAHDLNNLVVLCETCHPKWEGRDHRPNALDADGRVKLSQLVHSLSRDTIERLYEPPGPWILTRWFYEVIYQSNNRCRMCFHALSSTRARTDHCSACGRPPVFWADENAYSLDRILKRVVFACSVCADNGIPVEPTTAKRVAKRCWNNDAYESNRDLGRRLVMNAVYASITAAYDPDEVTKSYEPICPEPTPIRR